MILEVTWWFRRLLGGLGGSWMVSWWFQRWKGDGLVVLDVFGWWLGGDLVVSEVVGWWLVVGRTSAVVGVVLAGSVYGVM